MFLTETQFFVNENVKATLDSGNSEATNSLQVCKLLLFFSVLSLSFFAIIVCGVVALNIGHLSIKSTIGNRVLTNSSSNSLQMQSFPFCSH